MELMDVFLVLVCVCAQAVVGDGQVTQGSQVMKPNAKKVGHKASAAWRTC